jgi:hypothetical protein
MLHNYLRVSLLMVKAFLDGCIVWIMFAVLKALFKCHCALNVFPVLARSIQYLLFFSLVVACLPALINLSVSLLNLALFFVWLIQMYPDHHCTMHWCFGFQVPTLSTFFTLLFHVTECLLSLNICFISPTIYVCAERIKS